jgi:hypothetical protein
MSDSEMDSAFTGMSRWLFLIKLFSENHGAADNAYAPNNIYDCLVSVLWCALQCSMELPKERIVMKEVVKELNSAKGKLLM